MKVGVRCCFGVSRPPAKFHRIRSPFDAPTYKYSGIIAGLTSDVFGLRKPCRAASLPSSLRPTRSSQSARPNLTSLVSPRTSLRARLKLPQTRTAQLLPLHSDHLQTSVKHHRFICLDSLVYFPRPFNSNLRDQMHLTKSTCYL